MGNARHSGTGWPNAFGTEPGLESSLLLNVADGQGYGRPDWEDCKHKFMTLREKMKNIDYKIKAIKKMEDEPVNFRPTKALHTYLLRYHDGQYEAYRIKQLRQNPDWKVYSEAEHAGTPDDKFLASYLDHCGQKALEKDVAHSMEVACEVVDRDRLARRKIDASGNLVKIWTSFVFKSNRELGLKIKDEFSSIR